MEPKYVITRDYIARELEVSGAVNVDSREPVNFMQTLGTRVPLDTGLLPPGLRSYSQAGEHSQMVIELPPGINMLHWSESEHSARKGEYQTYRVAQPYRVIVASFLKGNLLGARMFYSPHPIANLNQPLYHQNVPNINCEGYNGTAVGWVCLYHTEDWSTKTIAERAEAVIERCSGAEAYNNRNMYETDGTRFYGKRGMSEFLSDPVKWEAKTETDGLDWVLDPELWIPVEVESIDRQAHHTDGGTPLTVRMAMNGRANMYYDDEKHPKPDAALRRDDIFPDPQTFFQEVIQEAFVHANMTDADTERSRDLRQKLANGLKAKVKVDKNAGWAVATAPKPGTQICEWCEGTYYQEDMKQIANYGWICYDDGKNFVACPGCMTEMHKDDMVLLDNTYWCAGDAAKVMKAQKIDAAKAKEKAKIKVALEEALTAAAAAKTVMADQFTCSCCKGVASIVERMVVNTPQPGLSYELCAGCASNKFMCNSCYALEDNNKQITTTEWKIVCVTCAAVCNECGKIILKSNVKNGNKCPSCDDAPF